MAIIIFQFAVFIVSVIVHEISHGAVAYWLGDETAYRMGRLTMNPVSHIDPFGSIILPLVLSIPLLFGIQPVIVGWAKPVPYNPNNLKNPKSGAGLIAWRFCGIAFARPHQSPNGRGVPIYNPHQPHARRIQPRPYSAARRFENPYGIFTRLFAGYRLHRAQQHGFAFSIPLFRAFRRAIYRGGLVSFARAVG
jgi:hypothetical protein